MKNKVMKRALITAWSLNEMGGVGLNCFELAEELRRRGIITDWEQIKANDSVRGSLHMLFDNIKRKMNFFIL